MIPTVRKSPSKLSSKMPALLVEASSHVRELGGDTGYAYQRIWKAYQHVKDTFTENRVRDLYHADRRCHVVEAEVLELRAAVAEYRRVKTRELIKQQRQREQAARNELLQIRDQIASMEAGLMAQDPDYAREMVAGFRESVGLGGRGNSSVAED